MNTTRFGLAAFAAALGLTVPLAGAHAGLPTNTTDLATTPAAVLRTPAIADPAVLGKRGRGADDGTMCDDHGSDLCKSTFARRGADDAPGDDRKGGGGGGGGGDDVGCDDHGTDVCRDRA